MLLEAVEKAAETSVLWPAITGAVVGAVVGLIIFMPLALVKRKEKKRREREFWDLISKNTTPTPEAKPETGPAGPTSKRPPILPPEVRTALKLFDEDEGIAEAIVWTVQQVKDNPNLKDLNAGVILETAIRDVVKEIDPNGRVLWVNPTPATIERDFDLQIGVQKSPRGIEVDVEVPLKGEVKLKLIRPMHGSVGVQGHQGWQGLQGIQGVQGHQGWSGLQGLQGPQGMTGSTVPPSPTPKVKAKKKKKFLAGVP